MEAKRLISIITALILLTSCTSVQPRTSGGTPEENKNSLEKVAVDFGKKLGIDGKAVCAPALDINSYNQCTFWGSSLKNPIGLYCAFTGEIGFCVLREDCVRQQ
jgi:hypothetical protein